MYKLELPIKFLGVELNHRSNRLVEIAEVLILYTIPPPGLFSFFKKTTTQEYLLNLDTLKMRDDNFHSFNFTVQGTGEDGALHSFSFNLKDRNVMSSKINRNVLDLNNIVFGVEHQPEYCWVIKIKKPNQYTELLWIDIPSVRFSTGKIEGSINLCQVKHLSQKWVSCVDTHHFVIEKTAKSWFLSVE